MQLQNSCLMPVLLNSFSSPCTETIPTYSSTPPRSPSSHADYTLTTQSHFSSTLPSSSPTTKVDLAQTLSSSHPSDNPPQLTRPPPVSAASISQPQPQPQSSQASKVLRGPSKASDETSQQLIFPNLMSTTQLGTTGCR